MASSRPSEPPTFNGLPKLSSWLAETMPNVFGIGAGTNNLRGMSSQQLGAIFLGRFVLSDKLDAQVMATALNVYATNSALGGGAAVSYGFSAGQYGLGDSTWNIQRGYLGRSKVRQHRTGDRHS